MEGGSLVPHSIVYCRPGIRPVLQWGIADKGMRTPPGTGSTGDSVRLSFKIPYFCCLVVAFSGLGEGGGCCFCFCLFFFSFYCFSPVIFIFLPVHLYSIQSLGSRKVCMDVIVRKLLSSPSSSCSFLGWAYGFSVLVRSVYVSVWLPGG